MSKGGLPLHVQAELADDASLHPLSTSTVMRLAQPTLCNHTKILTALQGDTKMGLAHTLTSPGDEAALSGPQPMAQRT